MRIILLIILMISPLLLKAEGKLVQTQKGIDCREGLYKLDSTHCMGIIHNSTTVSIVETTDQGYSWSKIFTFDLDTIDNNITSIDESFILDEKHWYFPSVFGNDQFFFTTDGGKSFQTRKFQRSLNKTSIFMLNPPEAFRKLSTVLKYILNVSKKNTDINQR